MKINTYLLWMVLGRLYKIFYYGFHKCQITYFKETNKKKKKVKFLINIEIVIEGELLRKEKKLITTISSFSIQKIKN